MQNVKLQFKIQNLRYSLSSLLAKKIFLIIPIGLIGMAAVLGSVFLTLEMPAVQNETFVRSDKSFEEALAPANTLLLPSIQLPELTRKDVTIEELKQFEIDSDQDGLTDFLENFYQTDPSNADSDGDGYKDGEEVEKGYNPNGEGQL